MFIWPWICSTVWEAWPCWRHVSRRCALKFQELLATAPAQCLLVCSHVRNHDSFYTLPWSWCPSQSWSWCPFTANRTVIQTIRYRGESIDMWGEGEQVVPLPSYHGYSTLGTATACSPEITGISGSTIVTENTCMLAYALKNIRHRK